MKEVKLASRLASLQESATLALNTRAKQLAAEGKEVYNLTAGELSTGTPDYIQTAVATKLECNKYTPVAGLPELRQKIADHAHQYYELDWISPENVVVTAGAKPALYATFLTIVNPGDEVIVLIPGWVSYMDLIKLAGGVVVKVPLSKEYDLDVVAITASITPKTKAIIINSPHNPTGAIFSKKSIDQLTEALKNTNITVISDDIYSQLVFEGDFTPTPKAGFDNLVIINGFSKSQALTGWRIGYLIADKPVAKSATDLLSHITGNAPLPSQYAAIAAMAWQDKPPATTLKDLKLNRDLVQSGLKDIPGLKYNKPAGAFYTYLDLRGITDDSAKWCETLLDKTGVALVPGEAFMTPGFARLTFSGDAEVLKTALKLIREFVAKAAP